MILLQGKNKEGLGNMMFVRWGGDIWQCLGSPGNRCTEIVVVFQCLWVYGLWVYGRCIELAEMFMGLWVYGRCIELAEMFMGLGVILSKC